MKIVQINAVCGSGSTGRICVEISRLLTERNIENYILYSFGKSDYPLGIKYSNDKYVHLNAVKSKLLGNYGFNSHMAAKRLVAQLERIKPDIVHLHNIHGHDADLKTLFDYLAKRDIKVIWTFHDCWAFTGYCAHFDYAGCEKWRTRCGACPQKRRTSRFFDRSGEIYDRKKALFGAVGDITVVTPSEWLAGLVRESFFKDRDIRVINNGIDFDVFHPTESDFRERYKIGGRKLLLGAAYIWGARKGLGDLLEAVKRLGDGYVLAVVGDVGGAELGKGVIRIPKTESQTELAEIYSAADIFVNPTKEEVLGLVNIEALACGTPVATYATGGSVECVGENTGAVVPKENIDALVGAIEKIAENTPSKQECIEFAKSKFEKNACYKKYLDLYSERLEG